MKLDLTWFGGEPLLGFDVIEIFIKKQKLKKKKICIYTFRNGNKWSSIDEQNQQKIIRIWN